MHVRVHPMVRGQTDEEDSVFILIFIPSSAVFFISWLYLSSTFFVFSFYQLFLSVIIVTCTW